MEKYCTLQPLTELKTKYAAQLGSLSTECKETI